VSLKTSRTGTDCTKPRSESDANKLPTRIEEARRALIARVRELFEDSTNSGGETHCIEGALYVLHAWKAL
jgi:hypothetical protein